MAAELEVPRGPTWFFEDFKPGLALRTMSRLIGDAEINAYVSQVGMYEQVFLTAQPSSLGASGRRLVPGVMTLSFAEGLVVLTGVFRHGLALLSFDGISFVSPVHSGDVLSAQVKVVEARRTKTGNRGVVQFEHTVWAEPDVVVLEYRSARMVAGRPA